VLSRVADAIVLEFVSRMTREWLPGRDCQLLYRGSRDGMTPAAFHDKCDERLPTIVLIAGQSDGHPVSVFGGYASKSWKSSRCFVDARDSFLFSILNPFGDGIVHMPIPDSSTDADKAMWCDASHGPSFGYGNYAGRAISVRNYNLSSQSPFDTSSSCFLTSGGTFGDPLGRGHSMFTGSPQFTPLEIEVWRIV
jgi:hypothetical protein